MKHTTNTLSVLLVLVLSAGCGQELRRFPLQEPMWVDDDQHHVEETPDDYWSGLVWDGADQIAFYPLVRFFQVDPGGAAANVNALDEVPDSSWWTNRIGTHPFTPEDARVGACPEVPIEMEGPWTVTDAKPNGANPGFIIRAADGRRYLLKFDGSLQPERATCGDTFGSRLYYALGYYTPCNVIISIDPAIFVIAEDAETEDAQGNDRPMNQSDLESVLDAAVVLPDGRLRGSASLFLPGRPLGPFKYQDTRSDDPNDVIRHDDRRELRANYVASSWLNHFDSREQNTLDVWIEGDDGVNYIRHYMLDWGDSFGSEWPQDDMTRRLGTSGYFHWGHVFSDFLTLGLLSRVYDQLEPHPKGGEIFGYYSASLFTPDEWRPGYPNPSFSRMTAEDGAWIARKIAYLSDDHLAAMVDECRLNDSGHEAYLLEAVIDRRDRILEHWLRQRSPLFEYEVAGEGNTQLCVTNLAARTGVTNVRTDRYETTMYFGDFTEPAWRRFEPATGLERSDRICIDLVEGGARPSAAVPNAPEDSADRYAIVDVVVYAGAGTDRLPPARFHFYDLGGQDGFALVGVERPETADPPL